MKNIVRTLLALSAVGLAGFFSGCATTRTAHASGAQPAYSFTVVDSSVPLTANQQSEVAAAVARFMERQGMELVAETFLRVDLSDPELSGPAEWAMVKVTSFSNSAYSVVAHSRLDESYYYSSPYGYSFFNQPYGYFYEPFAFYGSLSYFRGRNHRPYPYVPPSQPKDGKPGDHRPNHRNDHTPGPYVNHDRTPDNRDNHGRGWRRNRDGTTDGTAGSKTADFTPRASNTPRTPNTPRAPNTPRPWVNGSSGNTSAAAGNPANRQRGSGSSGDNRRNGGQQTHTANQPPRSYDSGRTRDSGSSGSSSGSFSRSGGATYSPPAPASSSANSESSRRDNDSRGSRVQEN